MQPKDLGDLYWRHGRNGVRAMRVAPGSSPSAPDARASPPESTGAYAAYGGKPQATTPAPRGREALLAQTTRGAKCRPDDLVRLPLARVPRSTGATRAGPAAAASRAWLTVEELSPEAHRHLLRPRPPAPGPQPPGNARCTPRPSRKCPARAAARSGLEPQRPPNRAGPYSLSQRSGCANPLAPIALHVATSPLRHSRPPPRCVVARGRPAPLVPPPPVPETCAGRGDDRPPHVLDRARSGPARPRTLPAASARQLQGPSSRPASAAPPIHGRMRRAVVPATALAQRRDRGNELDRVCHTVLREQRPVGTESAETLHQAAGSSSGIAFASPAAHHRPHRAAVIVERSVAAFGQFVANGERGRGRAHTLAGTGITPTRAQRRPTAEQPAATGRPVTPGGLARLRFDCPRQGAKSSPAPPLLRLRQHAAVNAATGQ